MSWGEVELEPEVVDWYLSLTEEEVRGLMSDFIWTVSRLEVPCSMSHVRSSWTASCGSFGSVPPRRSRLGSRATRITYWIAPGGE